MLPALVVAEVLSLHKELKYTDKAQYSVNIGLFLFMNPIDMITPSSLNITF